MKIISQLGGFPYFSIVTFDARAMLAEATSLALNIGTQNPRQHVFARDQGLAMIQATQMGVQSQLSHYKTSLVIG